MESRTILASGLRRLPFRLFVKERIHRYQRDSHLGTRFELDGASANAVSHKFSLFLLPPSLPCDFVLTFIMYHNQCRTSRLFRTILWDQLYTDWCLLCIYKTISEHTPVGLPDLHRSYNHFFNPCPPKN